MALFSKPEFDHPPSDGKSYVCLKDGQFHAYLDRDAAIGFLYDLHWLAQDQTVGEEISIRSGLWSGLPQCGKPIGYCEFNLTQVHAQKKQGKNILKNAQPTVRNKPHGVYSPENDRLDYFVSPGEVKEAYAILTRLIQNSESRHASQEATLFGTLTIHLVSE